VQNDVDAHAAGEAWLGAAAGLASVLVVAVGTGVGGAVVMDGTPLRGAHHVAGEIGHLPTPGAEGLRCTCGRPGHLEALGSGPALHRHYMSLGGAPESPDARDVVARAAQGDPTAVRAVQGGAHVVALDGIRRPRPDGLTLFQTVSLLRDQSEILVIADCGSLDDALVAADAGVDIVSTTLAGYTGERPRTDGADMALLEQVVRAVPVPVIAEGRIHTPVQAASHSRPARTPCAWARPSRTP
jgi:hypothetical protein